MPQIVEFASNHPFMVSGLLGVFFLLVFYEIRLKSAGLTTVSPAEATRLMNRGAMIIDVRDSEQYANGHIVNARNHPLGELDTKPETLKKYQGKPVITVCDNGIAANRGAGVLRKQGFQNVFSLKGGLSAWRQENLPVVRK